MSDLTPHSGMADKVWALQSAMLAYPQIEPETHHYFANGLYVRTIFSEAGTVIVGKVHKTEHIYAVLTGRVQVTMGDEVIELDANKNGPQFLTCPAGTKRAVHILEDSWRMNAHINPSNTQELEKLESELVEDDPSSPFLADNKLKQELLP